MERRGVSDNSPVKGFVGRVYKVIAISSELMARVGDESRKVVYNGIVRGLAIWANKTWISK